VKESLALQRFYHPSVPRTPCQVKPDVPVVTKKETYLLPGQQAMFTFATNFSQANNLHFVTVGSVCQKENNKFPFQVGFWGHQRLSVEEARALMAKCASEFFHFTQTNKDTIDYMKLYMKERAPATPEMKLIALRMSFWDDNIDRQPEPYIAEIRLENEKVSYFTADENQFLKLVLEEPLGTQAST
jgi:hypothetical protein